MDEDRELMQVLLEAVESSRREVKLAMKRARINPRFKSGLAHWKGMLQAYENAYRLVKSRAKVAGAISSFHRELGTCDPKLHEERCQYRDSKDASVAALFCAETGNEALKAESARLRDLLREIRNQIVGHMDTTQLKKRIEAALEGE